MRELRVWSLRSVLLAVMVVARLAGADRGVALESSPRYYFTDNLGATQTSPGITPVEQALLELIGSAQTSIDAAIYDFNRASIRDALLDARQRGVAVRVVADDEARASSNSKATYDALAAVGIPIVTDGAAAGSVHDEGAHGVAQSPPAPDAEMTSGLMHDKYLIVDGLRVWSGSVNLSDTDLTLNHNHALVIEGAAAAARYSEDFTQMFGGAFGTDKVASITTTVTISGVSASVYFSPQDDPMSAVIDLVDGAQESIDFAIFYFTHDGLRDALLNAHSRGVAVRGLWDALGAGDANADDEALCAGGVPIQIENTSGKMHHKLMIVDADGAKPAVVTGSLNWTAAGGSINNENTVILRDAVAGQTFAAEFDKMWVGAGGAPCNPEAGTTRVLLPVAARQSGPPPKGSAGVRLHTIVYDPPGVDAEGEYAALINEGAASQSMAGWGIADVAGNRYTFPDFALASGAMVRIWVRSGVNTASDLYWGVGRAVWNNDGDTATLRDQGGTVIDTCSYTGGEGSALCASTQY